MGGTGGADGSLSPSGRQGTPYAEGETTSSAHLPSATNGTLAGSGAGAGAGAGASGDLLDLEDIFGGGSNGTSASRAGAAPAQPLPAAQGGDYLADVLAAKPPASGGMSAAGDGGVVGDGFGGFEEAPRQDDSVVVSTTPVPLAAVVGTQHKETYGLS